MKITLINPPAPLDDVINIRARQPLGIAWVAAVLREEGHEVEVMDMTIEERDVPTGRDLIIITSSPLDRWETPYLKLENVYEMFRKAKATGAKTVLTGPHGSVTPDLMFERCPELDILIRGEAEATARELVQSMDFLDAVKGISYRGDDGFVKHNLSRPLIEDLDTLPIPAYDLLPMAQYHYNVHQATLPSPFTIVETTRGCPYACTFCLKVMHGGRNYRMRSAETVINEIKYLQKEHGIKSIYFQDLEFTINKPRVREICQRIIDEGIELKWACASRVNDAQEELLKLMAQAGCQSISFGVESMSGEILKNTKKGTTPEMIAKAERACEATGIFFNTFYTKGHLGESRRTMADSIKNAYELGVSHPLDRGAKIIPYPGTEMYEHAKAQGLIQIGDWEEVAALRGKVGTEEGYDKPSLRGLYYFARMRISNLLKKKTTT